MMTYPTIAVANTDATKYNLARMHITRDELNATAAPRACSIFSPANAGTLFFSYKTPSKPEIKLQINLQILLHNIMKYDIVRSTY